LTQTFVPLGEYQFLRCMTAKNVIHIWSNMKISVKKAQPQVYAVSFGTTVHTLDIHDLKTLVLEVVGALSPGVLPPPSCNREIFDLASRLTAASDSALQEFILHASDGDLLVFLKSTETDTSLHQKLFANMSERKHTILSEDLQFRFQDPVSVDEQSAAVFNLSELASKHHL